MRDLCFRCAHPSNRPNDVPAPTGRKLPRCRICGDKMRVRAVSVECETAAGFRQLHALVAQSEKVSGAYLPNVSERGVFVVTNQDRWAITLQAVGGREI
jgi:hypothetical protein